MAVKQTFTGDEKQLTRALNKIERDYAKLEERLQRLTNESEKSQRAGEKNASSMGSAAESAVGKLTQMAGTYVGISQAMELVNTALQRQVELQGKNLEYHNTLAVSQQALLLNAGAQAAGLVPQIQGMAERTFVGEEPLTQAASFAVSSKGEETIQRALQTVEASARMTPNLPSDIPTFTQAGLQVMNAVGAGQLAPEDALGFLQSAAARASTSEPGQFFKNAAPVAFAGAIQDPGDTRRGVVESTALMTMFTGRGDPEGTISSSATINYMGKIAEFFKTQSTIDDPVSLFGRIGALQTDPNLREAFIEGGGLKGKLAGKVRTQAVNLLQEGSAEAEALVSIRGDLALDRASYDERVAQMGTMTPALQLALRQRQSTSAAQEFMRLNPELGAQSAARLAVEEGLSGATGFLGNLDATYMSLSFRANAAMTGDAIKYGTKALQARQGSLRLGGIQADERDEYDLLDRQLKVLEGLREDFASSRAAVGAANAQPNRHAEN